MPGTYKVYVTDATRLAGKYGASARAIYDAVERIVAADADRGLLTRLVYVDDEATMAAFGAAAVPTNSAAPVHYKHAVDALCRSLTPEYLVLLGAQDVLPNQILANPVFVESDLSADPDRMTESDLPYASDAPYSTNPADFIGASRVVGRLPDLVGESDPEYLVSLLLAGAAAEPQPSDVYRQVFAISAQAWQESTSLTLRSSVGIADNLHTSPEDGPEWAASAMGLPTHFINCHGARDSAIFRGEGATSGVRREALNSALVERGARPGTVVVAECCYGAQLFAPASMVIPGVENSGTMSIANAYLAREAHCFLGSTTTSFGGATRNQHADVLCGEFLRYLIAGASTGSALLMARQAYVAGRVLQPEDLKTLAQFVLLGDPSVHPTQGRHAAVGDADLEQSRRAGRRQQALLQGVALQRGTVVSGTRMPGPLPATARAELERIAADLGLEHVSIRRFRLHRPQDVEATAVLPASLDAGAAVPTASYLLSGWRPATNGLSDRVTAFVSALEVDGGLAAVQVSHGKWPAHV
jgi:hypothetical protein